MTARKSGKQNEGAQFLEELKTLASTMRAAGIPRRKFLEMAASQFRDSKRSTIIKAAKAKKFVDVLEQIWPDRNGVLVYYGTFPDGKQRLAAQIIPSNKPVKQYEERAKKQIAGLLPWIRKEAAKHSTPADAFNIEYEVLTDDTLEGRAKIEEALTMQWTGNGKKGTPEATNSQLDRYGIMWDVVHAFQPYSVFVLTLTLPSHPKPILVTVAELSDNDEPGEQEDWIKSQQQEYEHKIKDYAFLVGASLNKAKYEFKKSEFRTQEEYHAFLKTVDDFDNFEEKFEFDVLIPYIAGLAGVKPHTKKDAREVHLQDYGCGHCIICWGTDHPYKKNSREKNWSKSVFIDSKGKLTDMDARTTHIVGEGVVACPVCHKRVRWDGGRSYGGHYHIFESLILSQWLGDRIFIPIPPELTHYHTRRMNRINNNVKVEKVIPGWLQSQESETEDDEQTIEEKGPFMVKCGDCNLRYLHQQIETAEDVAAHHASDMKHHVEIKTKSGVFIASYGPEVRIVEEAAVEMIDSHESNAVEKVVTKITEKDKKKALEHYEEHSKEFRKAWNTSYNAMGRAKDVFTKMLEDLTQAGYTQGAAINKIAEDHEGLQGFSRATLYRQLPQEMKRTYTKKPSLPEPAKTDQVEKDYTAMLKARDEMIPQGKTLEEFLDRVSELVPASRREALKKYMMDQGIAGIEEPMQQILIGVYTAGLPLETPQEQPAGDESITETLQGPPANIPEHPEIVVDRYDVPLVCSHTVVSFTPIAELEKQGKLFCEKCKEHKDIDFSKMAVRTVVVDTAKKDQTDDEHEAPQVQVIEEMNENMPHPHTIELPCHKIVVNDLYEGKEIKCPACGAVQPVSVQIYGAEEGLPVVDVISKEDKQKYVEYITSILKLMGLEPFTRVKALEHANLRLEEEVRRVKSMAAQFSQDKQVLEKQVRELAAAAKVIPS